MPGVHRKDDTTTGHGCWPPTMPASYSPDVFVNGQNVVRAGDTIKPHTCPTIPETHAGAYIGSHNVFVNGQPIQTGGDPIDCGDFADSCSGDVYVN